MAHTPAGPMRPSQPPQDGGHPPASTATPAEVLTDQTLQRFYAFSGWLANVSGCVAMSLIMYLLPRLMTELQISATVHGFVVMMGRVAVVSTYLVLHFTRFWRYRLAPGLLAQGIAMVGLLVLSLATSVPLLTAGVMMVGAMMGFNYFSSIFYSTTGFSARRRGLATGLHEGSLAVGFTAGSLGGGYLGASLGVRVPFQVAIIVLAASAGAQLARYVWFKRSRPHPDPL